MTYTSFQIAADYGIKRQHFVIGLCCLCIMPLIATFLVYPKFTIKPLTEAAVDTSTSGKNAPQDNCKEITTEPVCHSVYTHAEPATCQDSETGSEAQINGIEKATSHYCDGTEKKGQDSNSTAPLTLKEVLSKSTLYLFLVWFSLSFTRFNYFIGSLNPWIISLTTDESMGTGFLLYLS